METTASRIYSQVKECIVDGHYPPGMRIVEQNVAKEFSSSRTPVREAMRMLASDGFLVFTPNSGTVVREWTVEQIRELFDLRALIEGEIADLSACKISDQEIEQLQSIQDQIERVVATQPKDVLSDISALNREFHQIIAKAGRNDRLMAMLAGAIEAPIIHKTFRSYSERELQRSLQHHRELIDALMARDGSWARSVMSAHIYAAKNALLGAK
ncbi:GntR family transcriptional regulator [Polynucleobacter sinensis]|uniref:GntR family transcriptional regulator n=1 Tax=Polynucleobacter sinensis TaxID=1743157 RepID=UPI000780C4EE|nr:GntR family transcriptional regulator [Polynucleobacter sinensis]